MSKSHRYRLTLSEYVQGLHFMSLFWRHLSIDDVKLMSCKFKPRTPWIKEVIQHLDNILSTIRIYIVKWHVQYGSYSFSQYNFRSYGQLTDNSRHPYNLEKVSFELIILYNLNGLYSRIDSNTKIMNEPDTNFLSTRIWWSRGHLKSFRVIQINGQLRSEINFVRIELPHPDRMELFHLGDNKNSLEKLAVLICVDDQKNLPS